MRTEKTYIAIDLKSFYASVECADRQLDPLKTNLVVADSSRTEKTICLAVSPSLKAWGIPGRARLFEVVQKVREIKKEHPEADLEYIVAPPRMARYMEASRQIYKVYMRYVSHEDIHVYSIDEVFIDATDYLRLYRLSAEEFARKLITEVLHETGITATAGIGPNLYLCKVAMDVMAKKIPADEFGVRIASLDEMSYREQLWDHRPITDFWRVGRGTAQRLADHGMYTMGDVARCSAGKPSDLQNEDLLYRLFGVNAELLIDHAWGWEPCTIADVKAYEPEDNSISSGQVLSCPYSFEDGLLVAREMADMLAMDLFGKGLTTDRIDLTVGYDSSCLTDPAIRAKYHGPVTADYYGRKMPKAAHGARNLTCHTSSAREITDAVTLLYRENVNPDLTVKRMYLAAEHVLPEGKAPRKEAAEQLDLFTDYEARAKEQEAAEKDRAQEKKQQEVILQIKEKFGKNAILKGMSLQDAATARERNNQIGGHKK